MTGLERPFPNVISVSTPCPGTHFFPAIRDKATASSAVGRRPVPLPTVPYDSDVRHVLNLFGEAKAARTGSNIEELNLALYDSYVCKTWPT